MGTGDKKGFTLVEILVVLAIFSIMIAAISAVFISGIKIQANSVAQEQLLDQVNYAVENMSRSIRTAKKDIVGSCITSGDNYLPASGSDDSLGFIKKDSVLQECVYFRLVSDAIYKGDSGSDGVPLTSDDIKVTSLEFNVLEGEGTSGHQPKVTVYIEAESTRGDPLQRVRIQTTISQRDLNKN